MGDKEMATGEAPLETDAKDVLRMVAYRGSKLPPNYHSVVIARWLNSLKRLNRYFKMIDQDPYYSEYQKYIKALITRPNAMVRLAALEEDIDVIFGWSVYEGDTLHYVHIQEPYRGQKLSGLLIPTGTKTVTHMTKHWEDYFMKNPKSKYRHLKFNPFFY